MTYRLFKYTSAASARLCLQGNGIWFAYPDTLNDPLETRFSTPTPDDFLDAIRGAFARIDEMPGRDASIWEPSVSPEFVDIHARENDRLAAFCRQMGIFCAGQQPDHQAMWAYYGDQGKGVCFELEITDRTLEEQDLALVNVMYGGGPRLLNRAAGLAEILVEVAEDNPGITHQENWDLCQTEHQRKAWGFRSIMRAAARKHEHWAQERELRLLRSIPGNLPILDQVLRGVHIVGTEAPDFPVCQLLLRQRYPNVPITQWSMDTAAMHMAPSQFDNRPSELHMIGQ